MDRVNEVYKIMDGLQISEDYEELEQIANYAIDAILNDGVRVVHAIDYDTRGENATIN